MNVYTSLFPLGVGGEWIAFADNITSPVLETGNEIIYSGFAQLKHRLSDKVTVNVGFRYDNKKRHKGENVSNFSPRLALI